MKHTLTTLVILLLLTGCAQQRWFLVDHQTRYPINTKIDSVSAVKFGTMNITSFGTIYSFRAFKKGDSINGFVKPFLSNPKIK